MQKPIHVYTATHDGQIFSKRTRRIFTHVVIGRNPRRIPSSEWTNVWEEVTWHGRLEMAWKQADASLSYYDEVAHLPVEDTLEGTKGGAEVPFIADSVPLSVRFIDDDLFFEALQTLVTENPKTYAYEAGLNPFGVNWAMVHSAKGGVVLFVKDGGEYKDQGSPDPSVVKEVTKNYAAAATETALTKKGILNSNIKRVRG